MGANIDAIQAAADIGIQADHAADYSADEQGTMLNFESVSMAAAGMRLEIYRPKSHSMPCGIIPKEEITDIFRV